MKYRKLGTADIDVSVICLGTMTFGEQNSQIDGFQQMDYALDRGINFLTRKGVFVSGMLIAPFRLRDKPELNLPNLQVHYVKPGSSAGGELIERGEYLASLNDVKMKNLEQLYEHLIANKNKTIE